MKLLSTNLTKYLYRRTPKGEKTTEIMKPNCKKSTDQPKATPTRSMNTSRIIIGTTATRRSKKTHDKDDEPQAQNHNLILHNMKRIDKTAMKASESRRRDKIQ